MNLNTVYQTRYQLPEECWGNFDRDRVQNLNTVELYGLERVLSAFVEDYETQAYGERCTHIEDITRFNKDSVDILDGYLNTYFFNHYAIECIWMTKGGAIMLDCYDTSEVDSDGFNDVDLTVLPRVLFRLD